MLSPSLAMLPQPVAWRYRHRGDPWSVCDTEPEDVEPRRLEVQPLYAFQPSPAATVETVKACRSRLPTYLPAMLVQKKLSATGGIQTGGSHDFEGGG
jgi:hypothetical protein